MNIAVVEDERNTLRGITHLIARSGHHQVRSARSGLEGMELIREWRPDLVITDIRMPGMDGLEMLTTLREEEIACNFIILTGHADFQYAQKAIQLGGIDYLLKPLTAPDVQAALEKAEEVIRRQQAITPNDVLYWSCFSQKEHLEQHLPILEDWLATGGENRGVIAVRGDVSVTAANISRLREAAEAALSGEGKYLFRASDDSREFVILTASGLAVEVLAQRVRERALGTLSAAVAFGVAPLEAVEELGSLAGELMESLGWNLTLAREDLCGPVITPAMLAALHWEPYRYPRELEEQILRSISSNTPDRALEGVEAFFAGLRAHPYHYRQIRSAVQQLVTAVLYRIRKECYSVFAELDRMELIGWMEERIFLSSMENPLRNAIHHFVKYSRSILDCDNLTILRVIRIVEEEYGDKNLCLDVIAQRMNITAEYLSALFVKEMGIKFTAYLTQQRIEHAKRLLADRKLKIYQVAERIGYTEVSYFCRVFKKVTGQSPGDYEKGIAR